MLAREMHIPVSLVLHLIPRIMNADADAAAALVEIEHLINGGSILR